MLLDNRLPLRFWLKIRIHPVTGCWEWVAGKDTHGYGVFRLDGKTWRAHRVAYAALKAPLEPGKELHHACENPPCCNPDHLGQVTRRDHQALTPASVATINAAKTRCPVGHAYSPENTRIEDRPDGGDARRCLACERARGARRRTVPIGESNYDRRLADTCKRGHSLTTAWVDRNGTRKCRECNTLRAQERRTRARKS